MYPCLAEHKRSGALCDKTAGHQPNVRGVRVHIGKDRHGKTVMWEDNATPQA